MKIINAGTGGLQEIPFSLGEAKRGSSLSEVGISMNTDQKPEGPESVGYVTFSDHCMITKSDPDQRGVLVRINTRGTYTRGSNGEVKLLGGSAELIASGAFSYGDAGNLGGGSDELWHVMGPSVFRVLLCGGSRKGYGERALVVTRSFRVIMMKPDILLQCIAADQDPEISEVIRMFDDKMGEQIREALATADILEQDIVSQIKVLHFSLNPLKELISGMGIAVPGEEIMGVSGIQSGTLIPGDKALVYVSIGPGGGKRYDFSVIAEKGISRLKSRCEKPQTREDVLALIEDKEWYVAWQDKRDGKVVSVHIADKGGVHHYDPDLGHMFTEEWIGIASVQPDQVTVARIFGQGCDEKEATATDGVFAAAIAAAKNNK